MTNVVLDEVRVAQSSDLGGVAELYKAICDHQPLDEYGPTGLGASTRVLTAYAR